MTKLRTSALRGPLVPRLAEPWNIPHIPGTWDPSPRRCSNAHSVHRVKLYADTRLSCSQPSKTQNFSASLQQSQIQDTLAKKETLAENFVGRWNWDCRLHFPMLFFLKHAWCPRWFPKELSVSIFLPLSPQHYPAQPPLLTQCFC